MNKDELLKLDGLYVEYRTDDGVVHAVNGLDIIVHRGETLGIVGETGAGKTTTALSILRLLPKRIGFITGGKISYGGTDILNASEAQMRTLRGYKISMIFQDPMTSLNPTMTVGQQIKEVLKLHHKLLGHQDEQQVDEILRMVGIPPERKREYPFQFSGGMKQRIVIAMALVCEPELLIADEPTTALDVTIQAQILSMMKKLKEQYNTSLMMITHNMGIVAESCDRVAVVYAGQIIESGTVEEVYSRRQNHPYTVGLFNCIPDLNTTAKRLIPIEGFMADPRELPKGCKFHDRCKHATQRCQQEEPGFYAVGMGTQRIKCFMFKSSRNEV